MDNTSFGFQYTESDKKEDNRITFSKLQRNKVTR